MMPIVSATCWSGFGKGCNQKHPSIADALACIGGEIETKSSIFYYGIYEEFADKPLFKKYYTAKSSLGFYMALPVIQEGHYPNCSLEEREYLQEILNVPADCFGPLGE
jgi:hypothetical protein